MNNWSPWVVGIPLQYLISNVWRSPRKLWTINCSAMRSARKVGIGKRAGDYLPCTNGFYPFTFIMLLSKWLLLQTVGFYVMNTWLSSFLIDNETTTFFHLWSTREVGNPAVLKGRATLRPVVWFEKRFISISALKEI